MKLVFATTSPHRIKVIKYLGIPFEARDSKIDEYNCERPTNPIQLVKYLSKLKAEAVAKDCKNSLVIGMDSVGYLDTEILEKPKSWEGGFKRLKNLSGRVHQLHTGISLVNTNISHHTMQDCITTNISFRVLSNLEITNYLESDSRFNLYALGYNPVNSLSESFIESIAGDLNNFYSGFPIKKVLEMIEEAKK